MKVDHYRPPARRAARRPSLFKLSLLLLTAAALSLWAHQTTGGSFGLGGFGSHDGQAAAAAHRGSRVGHRHSRIQHLKSPERPLRFDRHQYEMVNDEEQYEEYDVPAGCPTSTSATPAPTSTSKTSSSSTSKTTSKSTTTSKASSTTTKRTSTSTTKKSTTTASRTPITSRTTSKTTTTSKATTTTKPSTTSKSTSTTPKATSTPPVTEPEVPSGANGKVNMGYFGNWDIYGKGYFPMNVPASNLTHVIYSFADVNSTGDVFLSDLWADEQIHYNSPGLQSPDTWNDPPGVNNLYGNMKRFGLMKQQNRSLKVLLSIGGWTYSPHFWPMAANIDRRKRFAQTAVQLLEDYGFDGIDVDWEYPADAKQATAFTNLLKELRTALDAAAARRTTKTRFLLTAAMSASRGVINRLDVKGMDASLDFWNVMAYDFAGSWSTTAGHQANLYNATKTSPASEASGSDAVQALQQAGVASKKLVLGMALYGRSFGNTQGLGKPFSGVGSGPGNDGSGYWNLNTLPYPSTATVTEDLTYAGASYSYDANSDLFISYDTPNVFDLKTNYINRNSLGGAMYWELSGDYATTSKQGSMVGRVANNLGKMDTTQNCVSYPFSKFANVKNGYFKSS